MKSSYIAGQRVAIQIEPPYDKWKLGYIHDPHSVSVVFDGHKDATQIHPRIPLLTVENLETEKNDLRRIQLREISGSWHDFIISKQPALAKSIGDSFLSGVWWYFNFTCFGGKLPWLPIRKTAQLKRNFAIYKSNPNLSSESIKISITSSFTIYGIYATIGHEIIHQWQRHNFFQNTKNTEPNKGHGDTFHEGMQIVMSHTPFKIEPTGSYEDEKEHFDTIEKRENSKPIYYVLLFENDTDRIFGWYSNNFDEARYVATIWRGPYREEIYESTDRAPTKRIKKGHGSRKFTPTQISDLAVSHIKEFGKPINFNPLSSRP